WGTNDCVLCKIEGSEKWSTHDVQNCEERKESNKIRRMLTFLQEIPTEPREAVTHCTFCYFPRQICSRTMYPDDRAAAAAPDEDTEELGCDHISSIRQAVAVLLVIDGGILGDILWEKLADGEAGRPQGAAMQMWLGVQIRIGGLVAPRILQVFDILTEAWRALRSEKDTAMTAEEEAERDRKYKRQDEIGRELYYQRNLGR